MQLQQDSIHLSNQVSITKLAQVGKQANLKAVKEGSTTHIVNPQKPGHLFLHAKRRY